MKSKCANVRGSGRTICSGDAHSPFPRSERPGLVASRPERQTPRLPETAWMHNMSTTALQTEPQAHAVSPKGMLIGGKWVDAKSGARIAIENPAKRVTIAEVPRAAAADVDAAVEAAAKAFPAWSKVAPRERGRLLLKIADVLEARAEEVARTIALETGNALRTQARGEAKTTA